MKKGDWLWDGGQEIGKAKSDPYEVLGDTVIDVAIYDRNGNKLGRTSPAMGGPKTFEPATDAAHWIVIKRPRFPLPRFAYLRELLAPKEQQS